MVHQRHGQMDDLLSSTVRCAIAHSASHGKNYVCLPVYFEYLTEVKNISCEKYVTELSAGVWLYMTITLRFWQKVQSMIFFATDALNIISSITPTHPVKILQDCQVCVYFTPDFPAIIINYWFVWRPRYTGPVAFLCVCSPDQYIEIAWRGLVLGIVIGPDLNCPDSDDVSWPITHSGVENWRRY